jgi:hypothetical protein
MVRGSSRNKSHEEVWASRGWASIHLASPSLLLPPPIHK